MSRGTECLSQRLEGFIESPARAIRLGRDGGRAPPLLDAARRRPLRRGRQCARQPSGEGRSRRRGTRRAALRRDPAPQVLGGVERVEIKGYDERSGRFAVGAAFGVWLTGLMLLERGACSSALSSAAGHRHPARHAGRHSARRGGIACLLGPASGRLRRRWHRSATPSCFAGKARGGVRSRRAGHAGDGWSLADVVQPCAGL